MTRKASKKDNILRGNRLVYNASQQEKYKKSLMVIVKKMQKETKLKLKSLFNDNTASTYFEHQEKAATDASLSGQAKTVMAALIKKFTKIFSDQSEDLAEEMVKSADKTSKSTIESSLKKMSDKFVIKGTAVPKGLENVTEALVNQNVALIKSIPSEYFDDVNGAVMRSITSGNGLEDLIPSLSRYDGISDRRINNMALDQTRKAYNNINKQRMLGSGITDFEWLHSGGSDHPREDHIEMSGNVYSFSKLPVIDKNTGERGIPGDAINCRCTMTPVIVLEDKENA